MHVNRFKNFLLLLFLSITMSNVYAYSEKVYLKKIIGDQKILIKRKNHDLYILKLGLGCSTINHYVGHKIFINSSSEPAFGFVDVSSRVYLERSDQDCTIWEATRVEPKKRNLSYSSYQINFQN